MIANQDDSTILLPYKGHLVHIKWNRIRVYVGSPEKYNTAATFGEAAVWGPEHLTMENLMKAKSFIELSFEKYEVWR